MSVFSTTAKNEMLDSLVVDRMLLHSGDPGVNGTANVVNQTDGVTPMTKQTVAFSAAASGERALSADKEFTGLQASSSVTWYSVWAAGSPDVFKGKAQLSGDTQTNSSGAIIVTTASELQLNNPA